MFENEMQAIVLTISNCFPVKRSSVHIYPTISRVEFFVINNIYRKLNKKKKKKCVKCEVTSFFKQRQC